MAVKGERKPISEIGTKSKDYEAMLSYWNLVQNLIDGIEAMKRMTLDYLPSFPAEDKDAYAYRLKIAKMTNVYRDIVETLSSKPFEQPIVIEDSSSEFDDWSTDVDGSGNDVNSFAMETFFYGINSAIDWIFVDFVKTDQSQTLSIADAKKIGNRPYWSRVLATNVWDARSRIVAGKEQLYYIKIFEPGPINHIRIMFIDDANVAQWELWREDKDKQEYVLDDFGPITIGVIPMVPFITGRRKGKSFQFNPMLRDAADLQLFLYRKENDLNYAEVMGCFPMISASGVEPKKDAAGNIVAMATGPGTILYAPPSGRDNSSGSYQLLEPAGSSYSQLAATIKTTIDQLRELGKMPLTAQTPGLTVITTAIAGGKAKTAIGVCALNLENALEMAGYITCLWLANGLSPKFKVNREFDDIDQSSEANKTQLGTMRRNGDLSQLTYWEHMKALGVLMDDFDEKKELERLAAETPVEDEEESGTFNVK